jgi:NitT/TauT family transport system substrate-binding protein
MRSFVAKTSVCEEALMVRRLCVALALCLALLPNGTPVAAQPAPTTIRLGVITIESAAEAFYALDMGFFKKQGLDVDLQIMQNGAAIAAAVAGGSLDVGFADTISIANAHARGLPFVYLAPALLNSYAAPSLAILVNGSGPIRDAKDLNGKTIAVNGINNITMVPVEAWIDKSGGDSKTVKWIELPIPAQNDAVSTGKVDGATLGEPFVTFGGDKGLRAIYMDKNAIAPRYMLAGFMTTKDWAQKNPAVAAKFIAAIKETAQWANTNHAASAAILSKYTKIPQPVVERMKRGEYGDVLLASEVQPVIDAAARYGVLPKAFPAPEFFYR